MVVHLRGIKTLMHEFEACDYLSHRAASLGTVDNASVADADAMHTQEVLVLSKQDPPFTKSESDMVRVAGILETSFGRRGDVNSAESQTSCNC